MAAAPIKRGLFVVVEGLDRSGKSTQVKRLVEALQRKGVQVEACRFPDRTTTIGTMINSYLTQTSELDDRAIHLLFSANRWERAKSILNSLEAGTTVICDRYAYSGIAFSAAKGLSYTWCQSPDVGLPAPDLVLFLDLSPGVAATRGGYGTERYETSTVQLAVRKWFGRIGEEVGEKWRVVDAGRGMDEVEKEVWERVEKAREEGGGEVGRMWEK